MEKIAGNLKPGEVAVVLQGSYVFNAGDASGARVTLSTDGRSVMAIGKTAVDRDGFRRQELVYEGALVNVLNAEANNRFCVNCRSCRWDDDDGEYFCRRKESSDAVPPSPVTGWSAPTCKEARSEGMPCGPKGDLFIDMGEFRDDD